jgi:hypothetical protein
MPEQPKVGKWYWCREGAETNNEVRVRRCAAVSDRGIVAAYETGQGLYLPLERVIAEVAVDDLPDYARQEAVARRTMLDVIYGMCRLAATPHDPSGA